MAPPRKYKTANDFATAVDKFIDYSTVNNIRPTDYQVCNYLGISVDTLERYAKIKSSDDNSKDSNNKGVDNNRGYAESVKKLVMYRQDWYLRHAEANPKLAGVDIFALKQPCNGGWTDRQVIDTGGGFAVDIRLSGADGKPFDDGK